MPTAAVTISTLKELWDRTLQKVKVKLNDDNIYSTFFADTYIHKYEGNKVTVAVSSAFAKALIEKSYMSLLMDTLSEVSETNLVIELVLADDIKKDNPPIITESKKASFFKNSVLKPNYTFETFVVGPSNREAQQAALMIASNPGKFYNPLFLYSSSGLGKTHLLHAIGNYIKERHPNLNILYISSDDFIDEYIRYVRGDKDSDNLKDYFKSIDVLLVDDIQFLAGRDKTQEMFFFIFNALVNANKQIVLTSDRQPTELKGLEERLVTRFSSGLNISIAQPDLETSIAILKRKVVGNGLDTSKFDEDVFEFIAKNFGNSVRDLEGGLNRLIFYAINMKQSSHIDLNMTLESFSNIINTKEAKKKLDENKIIRIVADYYNLTPSQLTGKIRTSEISLARHIAIYLCRDVLDMPFTKIGQCFGGKDHSTIMSAVKKVEKELKTNDQMKTVIKVLKNQLK